MNNFCSLLVIDDEQLALREKGWSKGGDGGLKEESIEDKEVVGFFIFYFIFYIYIYILDVV